jgi:hypothetical protein
LRYFGTLARDGTGDFDGDGISDLDEFLQGTDPSVPEGSITITFVPDLNVFSYPGIVTSPQATCRVLLASLGTPDEAENLARFNPVTQQFETCDHAGGANFPIVAGEGYVVWMRTQKALRLADSTACRAVTVTAGLNLIGPPASGTDLTCFGLLTAFGEETVAAIQRFHPTTGVFETCGYFDVTGSGVQPLGVDFPLVAGAGYLVHAKASKTVLPPGCSN